MRPGLHWRVDGPALVGAALAALAILGPDPEASESLRELGLHSWIGAYERLREQLPLPGYDKPIHGLLFFGLAALFHRPALARGWSAALAKSAMITFVYSAMLEGLQGLRASRGAEAWDLVANLVGIALYVALAWSLRRSLELRPHEGVRT